MRCAVVDQATNVVTNLIVADAAEGATLPGCLLVNVDGVDCGIGWLFDPASQGFFDPNPPEDGEM